MKEYKNAHSKKKTGDKIWGFCVLKVTVSTTDFVRHT